MMIDPDSTIVAVTIGEADILLDWSDGEQQRVRFARLRHSPGFPGGERPAGPAGRFPATDENLKPLNATLADSGELLLEWQPGGVRSAHAASWLRIRLEQERARAVAPAGQVLWDASSIESLPVFSYASLQDDETLRLRLFDQLLDWGVGLVREVPQQLAIVETAAGWFGQLQPNPYADDPARPLVSSIRVDPSTPVATHQSHFLGPHTDTCWRQTLTGLLLMHCLEAHPEGGRSLLVDGFAVAERLRATAPDAFELLSRLPLSFGAVVSADDQWRAQGRVISLSADGVVEGIRYNGNSIDQPECPDELVEPLYAALERFEAILYDRDLWWQPRLAPGDMLIIDNHRVLHGREAFDPALGQRHLQCCNVERDDFHNRYRRMARRQGAENWDRRLSAGVF